MSGYTHETDAHLSVCGPSVVHLVCTSRHHHDVQEESLAIGKETPA